MQDLLLVIMVILAFIAIITLIEEIILNEEYTFKILKPKITKTKEGKNIKLNIYVNKQYKYLINFPMIFKFYGNAPYAAHAKICYILPENNKKEIIIQKDIEFNGETIEFQTYITDIIIKKIVIEIDFIKVKSGAKPIIGFQLADERICENNKTLEIKL